MRWSLCCMHACSLRFHIDCLLSCLVVAGMRFPLLSCDDTATYSLLSVSVNLLIAETRSLSTVPMFLHLHRYLQLQEQLEPAQQVSLTHPLQHHVPRFSLPNRSNSNNSNLFMRPHISISSKCNSTTRKFTYQHQRPKLQLERVYVRLKLQSVLLK